MSMDASRLMKTLGSKRRLEILAWLADPEANFPPQRDGDLVDDGAGLVAAKPVGRWTFYRRDERGIAAALDVITDSLTRKATDGR